MIIAGRMEMLPLQDLIWQQFIDTVPPEKQSEIGLGMLSVSISASSAAALYLIRVGTVRWANNRRISYTYIFFADALMFRCDHAEPTLNSLKTVIRGFLDASLTLFEQIGETHKVGQFFYEQARLKAHLTLEEKEIDINNLREIALDLYTAGLVCRKRVELPICAQTYAADIRKRLKIGYKTA